jgi:hypothetical protein
LEHYGIDKRVHWQRFNRHGNELLRELPRRTSEVVRSWIDEPRTRTLEFEMGKIQVGAKPDSFDSSQR